jgi:hypothetical protein
MLGPNMAFAERPRAASVAPRNDFCSSRINAPKAARRYSTMKPKSRNDLSLARGDCLFPGRLSGVVAPGLLL